MNASPPVEPERSAGQTNPEAHELGRRARGIGVIVWSGFLAAAISTMLCFAFLDPDAIQSGAVPAWWSSPLRVYAVGFFFFWLIGLIAAALCWQLSRGRNDG